MNAYILERDLTSGAPLFARIRIIYEIVFFCLLLAAFFHSQSRLYARKLKRKIIVFLLNPIYGANFLPSMNLQRGKKIQKSFSLEIVSFPPSADQSIQRKFSWTERQIKSNGNCLNSEPRNIMSLQSLVVSSRLFLLFFCCYYGNLSIVWSENGQQAKAKGVSRKYGKKVCLHQQSINWKFFDACVVLSWI